MRRIEFDEALRVLSEDVYSLIDEFKKPDVYGSFNRAYWNTGPRSYIWWALEWKWQDMKKEMFSSVDKHLKWCYDHDEDVDDNKIFRIKYRFAFKRDFDPAWPFWHLEPEDPEEEEEEDDEVIDLTVPTIIDLTGD